MFAGFQFIPLDLTLVCVTAGLLILGTPVLAWRRRRTPLFWLVFVVPAFCFGLINSVGWGVDEYSFWGFPCRYAHVNVTNDPKLSADGSFILYEENFNLLALFVNVAVALGWSYPFAVFCCNLIRTEPGAPAADSSLPR